MLRPYSIKLGMTGANQGEVMQLLKTNGAEVIQTADGLCAKSPMSKDELAKLLGDGLQIEELHLGKEDMAELSKDVQAFLKPR